MPTGSVEFRARCGQFCFVYSAFMAKRARFAFQLRCHVLRARTRMEGVMVGLVLAVFLTNDLLLRAGNVEPNPGPGPDGKESGRTVQTRLTTAGGRPVSTSVDRRSSAGTEPTLGDLMIKLTSMESSLNSNFEQVRADIQDMRNEVSELQVEIQDWKEKVSALEKENDDLKHANRTLSERMLKLEDKADDLEGRSRRNNILVYGIDRLEEETSDNLELRLKDLFKDKLELTEDVEMDRVHRLGSKTKSPVIARCTFYKDKVKIMKAKQKLRGSDVFIGDDFSKGVREKRRVLLDFMKDIKQTDSRARLIHDHIVSNGKKFFLAPDGKTLIEK